LQKFVNFFLTTVYDSAYEIHFGEDSNQFDKLNFVLDKCTVFASVYIQCLLNVWLWFINFYTN